MTEQPITLNGESPDPEMLKREQKLVKIKGQNLRMLEGIQQAGLAVDLTQPRIEKMMEYLELQGLITYEQRIEEQERWEYHLRSQLQPMYQRIRAMSTLSGAPQQTASGLIVPGVNAPRSSRG